MPDKVFDPSRQSYKVTFTLPPEVNAKTACLCGDFNEWDKTAHPMKKQKGGGFKLTLKLEAGRHYHYRYFLDGERWENDWGADAYVPNEFGSEDSVLNLEVAPEN
jgi:1,4-alpha-glucan branching enzyme